MLRPTHEIPDTLPQVREHGRTQSEEHQSDQIPGVVHLDEGVRQRLQLRRVERPEVVIPAEGRSAARAPAREMSVPPWTPIRGQGSCGFHSIIPRTFYFSLSFPLFHFFNFST